MGRYSEPVRIKAAWWDDDEYAWVRTTLSFTSAQRLGYCASKVQRNALDSEEALAAASEAMAGALYELLEKWTLRKPGTAYEPGIDRPTWILSEEAIAAQPLQDVGFLFSEGMRIFSAANGAPAAIITEKARGEGLDESNFPALDADRVDIPGPRPKARVG